SIVPSFFFHSYALPRVLHSFPTRRSSDLSQRRGTNGLAVRLRSARRFLSDVCGRLIQRVRRPSGEQTPSMRPTKGLIDGVCSPLDRKSTRLNSSHVAISYAVFCLKKKKKQ